MPAHQVAWLADSVSLQLPELRQAVVRKLESYVSVLQVPLLELLRNPDDMTEGLQKYSDEVRRLGADQLGDSGSRLLLSSCGIQAGQELQFLERQAF